MSTLRPLVRRLASVRTNRSRSSLLARISSVASSRWTLSPEPEETVTANNRPLLSNFASPIRVRYFATTKHVPPQDDADDHGKKQEPKLEEESKQQQKEEPKQKELHKESLQFQAETRQLLDIVTHSLYTDKEVFLRELVSNASDALEKLRHLQVANIEGHAVLGDDVPLEIRIQTDELNQTLTITDTGIGQSREDLITNLGTIAKSGSKAFLNEISKAAAASGHEDEPQLDPARGIIGKFGVGFYSAFMVGDKVEVRSRSAYVAHEKEAPKVWTSEGVGTFEIGDLDDSIRQDRGSSIVIHLKNEHIQYSDEKRIEAILKKYSNFVNFPIYLNGNRVNTMEAVWAKDPKEVSEETYSAFYKFVARAFDEPLDRLHFRADAPLEIKALFFIPSFHSEKHGMGRMEPGVSLYSRKVLIEQHSPDLLPDWMRFVKGVVDSEDVPLSISREKPQDSALIAKLRKALTRKFISHLATMNKKRNDVYKGEFYNEYNFFLKEGICQDFEFQEPLSKLLYFETNKGMNKDTVSLDEYVARCPPEQKEIYYLCAPSRNLGLQSPYLEAFEKANREVLFVYSAIDDFVMANLEKFEGRPLVSVEKANIDLGSKSDEKQEDDGKERLEETQAKAFCEWFKTTLGEDKVASCRVTSRLGASPAVVVDTESGAMRRMMAMVSASDGREIDRLPKQQVEINPSHPIIVGMNAIRHSEPTLAKVLAEQVFDNCLMAAGLLDDGRSMLPRLNDMMTAIVKEASSGLPPVESVGANDDESSSSDDDDESSNSEDDNEAETEKKDDTTMEVDMEKKKDAFEKIDTSSSSQSIENK